MAKLHLVIGQSGLVGSKLFRVMYNKGETVLGTRNKYRLPFSCKLDIRNENEVLDFVEEIEPSVIYLPASLTNVDYCENNPKEGYETNVVGVRNIVEEANVVGAKLVYFSSDYIF